MYVCMYVFTYPPPWAECGTRSDFKRNTTGLNSVFSFSLVGCHTKIKEPNLLSYWLIAGGRIVGFMPFLRVLSLLEVQTALSRIRTRATDSIFYDDNDERLHINIVCTSVGWKVHRPTNIRSCNVTRWS